MKAGFAREMGKESCLEKLAKIPGIKRRDCSKDGDACCWRIKYNDAGKTLPGETEETSNCQGWAGSGENGELLRVGTASPYRARGMFWN